LIGSGFARRNVWRCRNAEAVPPGDSGICSSQPFCDGPINDRVSHAQASKPGEENESEFTIMALLSVSLSESGAKARRCWFPDASACIVAGTGFAE